MEKAFSEAQNEPMRHIVRIPVTATVLVELESFQQMPKSEIIKRARKKLQDALHINPHFSRGKIKAVSICENCFEGEGPVVTKVVK